MKRMYDKPQIVFDSFELSQSIAAGCELFSNIAWQQCPVDVGGSFGTIFTLEEICNRTPDDNEYKEICYDVPFEENMVFSS